MLGIITRGTTLSGKIVNAGELVEVDQDTFRKLFMTSDIREVLPDPIKAPVDEPKPQPKSKKK